jgi:type II secretory pathway component GspD/PulD (secretin)
VICVYRLEHSQASSVEQVLKTMLLSAGTVPGARVAVDPRTNSLIVVAPPEVHKHTEEVIRALDTQREPEPESHDELCVYHLKKSQASLVEKVLVTMLPGVENGSGARVAVDARLNSLIVAAKPEVHKHVEEIIRVLDTQPQREPEPEGHQIKVFSIMNADALSMAEVIDGIIDRENLRISVDERTNSIIARSDKQETLDMMEAILLRLDQAAEQKVHTFHVRIVWLMSGLAADAASKPADDLEDVLEELAAIGVANLRQVGQAMVNTLPDGQFEISSSPMLEEHPTEMGVQGTFRVVEGAALMQISLHVFQAIQLQADGTAKIEHKNLVNLDTVITAPHGQYVVLGVAPLGETTSVFVVRVTPSK